jgi:hypothetical protein
MLNVVRVGRFGLHISYRSSNLFKRLIVTPSGSPGFSSGSSSGSGSTLGRGIEMETQSFARTDILTEEEVVIDLARILNGKESQVG